jgi:hypothetical protein
MIRKVTIMNNEQELSKKSTVEESELDDRRAALKKLGKFSAYVAPFSVLALSAKGAQSGSGTTFSSSKSASRGR